MRRTVVIVGIVALAVFIVRGLVQACGPFVPEAVFVNLQRPDSLEAFAGGRLGLIEPTYARSYLCVAYRILSGVSLDVAEREAAVTLWTHRLTGWIAEDDSSNGLHAWLSERSKVGGVAPWRWGGTVSNGRWHYAADGFASYLDCPDAAYATAAATLRSRADRLGWQHPDIRAWVEAQDSVFTACSHPTRLPEATPGTPAARADRAYQAAALAFYQGAYDDAAGRFDRIAADAASPWRTLSPYLAARAVTRGAMLGSEDSSADSAGLAGADARIGAILADSTLNSVHAAALALRGYVRFHLDPGERLRSLSAALLSPHSGATLEQDLDDITLLLGSGRLRDSWGGVPATSSGNALSAQLMRLRTAADTTDLTNWVLTFQRGAAGTGHAVERWHTTHSVPWLVAALAAIPPTDPARAELLNAAGAVPADSPAAPMLAFHRARLLAAAGDTAGARTVLDATLASRSLPLSARNRMLDVLASMAPDFESWIRLEVRAPVWVWPRPGYDRSVYPEGFGDDSLTVAVVRSITQHPVCFDEEACTAFNYWLPLDYWLAAARNPALPMRLRSQLALSGWTRAVLVDRDSAALAITPTLTELVPGIAEDARAYARARTLAERHFAATMLILRTPGASPYLEPGIGRTEPPRGIDRYGDNWWRPTRPMDATVDSSAEPGVDSAGVAPSQLLRATHTPHHAHGILIDEPGTVALDFLTISDRRSLGREIARLFAVLPSPDWMASRVLSYARAHPTDSRVPEALHLAVRATQMGFPSARTQQLSLEAFTLLHRRYPGSPWTAKTKYWY